MITKAKCLTDQEDFFTKDNLYVGYYEDGYFITTDDDNSKNILFDGEFEIEIDENTCCVGAPV